MKIAYISTFPPKLCGIATFTQDLMQGIAKNQSFEQHIFAMIEDDDENEYDSNVIFKIRRNEIDYYLEAANFINENEYDFVVIEHEYGIFGGNSGIFILSLAKTIQCRLLVNLHTILKRPSNDEHTILMELARITRRLVVMSKYAVKILKKVYNIEEQKICYIPHGVPEFKTSHPEAKEKLKLQDKKVILTFGFIGRNKGIELVIKSLPKVVKNHPDTLYILAGKTHPNVLKHSGEEYREYLENLVEKNNLQAHVKFINSYVDTELLTDLLSACDIYITPYVNEAQITSGTLSYAIGAGAAVISTPYWHAKDLLANQRGILIPFKDKVKLAETIHLLFNDEQLLSYYRTNAKNFGNELTWRKIGYHYVELLDELKQEKFKPVYGHQFSVNEMPPFDLMHINRLTNHVGIIQHAKYATPNYFEGYCLDDNARALLLELIAFRFKKYKITDLHLSTYLAYIFYAQREDGWFRNFMNFQNQFLEEKGSEDSFGRTIWALGYFFRTTPVISHYEMAQEIFFKAKNHFLTIQSNRAIAYIMLGICSYLKSHSNDDEMIELLREMAQKLVNDYQSAQTENWQWFEENLTYDNALLPLALIESFEFLNDKSFYTIGVKTFEFLDQLVFHKKHITVIGNKDWYSKDKEKPCYIGQQPIDVSSMVYLYSKMYDTTKNHLYKEKMFTSFEWFFGKNDLNVPLYDFESKGCCDGLEQYGINRNQGAESTICFWLAYLCVDSYLNKED